MPAMLLKIKRNFSAMMMSLYLIYLILALSCPLNNHRKSAYYKFYPHIDGKKIYFVTPEEGWVFAYSKENCSFIWKAKIPYSKDGFSIFPHNPPLGDEKYLYIFSDVFKDRGKCDSIYEGSRIDVIEKATGKHVFSKRLTFNIDLYGGYHISPKGVWVIGKRSIEVGEDLMSSVFLVRVNRKSFEEEIFPICIDCRLKIHSPRPAYFPCDFVSYANEGTDEFLVFWVTLDDVIHVASVHESGSFEEKFSIRLTDAFFSRIEIWDDRIFIVIITPSNKPNLLYIFFKGNLELFLIGVGDHVFYVGGKAITFYEDKIYIIEIENGREETIQFKGAFPIFSTGRFILFGKIGEEFPYDVESIYLLDVGNLKIKDIGRILPYYGSTNFITSDGEFIYRLDVENRKFEKFRLVDGHKVCEQKPEKFSIEGEECEDVILPY